MSGAPPGAPTPTAAAAQGAGDVKAVRAQLELMEQDCARVSSANYATPFSSLEDAVDRLLPFHMLGAEEPMQTDAREVEGAALPSRLATSRHEAWHDLTMHKVNEYGAGLVMLEKRVRKAEQEALQRSQLPLLMLQSYATAEAQAMMVGERNRKVEEERRAAEKVAAEQRAVMEAQRVAAAKAEADSIAKQQQQQALMAQRQQLLLMQQQQAAAAAAVAVASQQQAQQQRQQASVPAGQQQQQQAQQQQQQQQQQMVSPGMPFMQPGILPAQGAGLPVRPPGQPQLPAQQQPPGTQQINAAQQKAAQLAALKARISQRK